MPPRIEVEGVSKESIVVLQYLWSEPTQTGTVLTEPSLANRQQRIPRREFLGFLSGFTGITALLGIGIGLSGCAGGESESRISSADERRVRTGLIHPELSDDERLEVISRVTYQWYKEHNPYTPGDKPEVKFLDALAFREEYKSFYRAAGYPESEIPNDGTIDSNIFLVTKSGRQIYIAQEATRWEIFRELDKKRTEAEGNIIYEFTGKPTFRREENKALEFYLLLAYSRSVAPFMEVEKYPYYPDGNLEVYANRGLEVFIEEGNDRNSIASLQLGMEALTALEIRIKHNLEVDLNVFPRNVYLGLGMVILRDRLGLSSAELMRYEADNDFAAFAEFMNSRYPFAQNSSDLRRIWVGDVLDLYQQYYRELANVELHFGENRYTQEANAYRLGLLSGYINYMDILLPIRKAAMKNYKKKKDEGEQRLADLFEERLARYKHEDQLVFNSRTLSFGQALLGMARIAAAEVKAGYEEADRL